MDESGTTYMRVKADVLPMLRWRDWFTSDERMAEFDTKYRPLVEADYDRPDYIEQGAGADWGNGKPPPSVIDSAEDGGLLWDESLSRKPTLVVEAQSVDDAGTARELVPGVDLDEAGSGDANDSAPPHGADRLPATHLSAANLRRITRWPSQTWH